MSAFASRFTNSRIGVQHTREGPLSKGAHPETEQQSKGADPRTEQSKQGAKSD